MKFLENTKASMTDGSLDGFRMRMIFSYRKCNPLPIWEEIDNSDKREIYLEEMRKFHQANLARQVKKTTGARRLLDVGQSVEQKQYGSGFDQRGEAELTPSLAKLHLERKSGESRSNLARKLHLVNGVRRLLGKGQSAKTPKKLQLQSDKHKIIKLANLTFFSEVGGQYTETGIGTLEAHVNGFLYTNDGGHFQIEILYEKINDAFCRVGDSEMQSLLHFSLHDHIMVGTRRIKDTQFRWSCSSEAPLNFVRRIHAIWGFLPRPHGPFDTLEAEYKFYGKLPLSDQQSIFYLTVLNLVRLEEAPSIMVGLREIEIVNLAEVEPGEIEMTVIPKDFKRGIVQINSIPLNLLAVIKRELDAANVKFYENKLRKNWAEIVQNIIKSPGNFIQEGAWDSYELETDDITLGYYSDASHGEDLTRESDFD